MTALYAFVHAAMQRPDAYTAADKMTKPVWLLILGASVPLTMMLSALGATIRRLRSRCLPSRCAAQTS